MAATALVLPSAAFAQSGGASVSDGEVAEERAERSAPRDSDSGEDASSAPTTSGPRARIVGGQAIAPAGAPAAVKTAIAAANRITGKPYRYGGGHGKVEDSAYDCSGAISYALIKAGLLGSPLPSGPFMRWGQPGPGKWITVWAHGGHAYVMIAGLRLDTGYRGRESSAVGNVPGSGPRWGYARSTAGFTPRHPAGL